MLDNHVTREVSLTTNMPGSLQFLANKKFMLETQNTTWHKEKHGNDLLPPLMGSWTCGPPTNLILTYWVADHTNIGRLDHWLVALVNEV